MNNIPQGQVASSNTRSSSHSGDGDAGNGENGESFDNYRNKIYNGGHGKSPDNHYNYYNSSGSRGADRGDGQDKDSGKDGCSRATGDSGTGQNNDTQDEDCGRGSVSYDIPLNDPRVHYTGSWVSKTTDDDDDSDDDSDEDDDADDDDDDDSLTTHSTVVNGSTVSVRFNGSAISVFGTVPACMSEPPTVAYFLDSLPPYITTLPHATADMPNYPLYVSPNLSLSEEHVLFINVTQTRFEIPYALAGFSLSRPAVFFNSSQSSQGTPATATPMATPSTTLPTVPASTSSTNHKTIGIVAGVLGSMVFLFIVGAVIFTILRRRTYGPRGQSERIYSENLRSRSETVYSTFTTTESILRNDPSIWNLAPSHVSSRVSEFPRPYDFLWPSDFAQTREDKLSSMEFAPPSRSLSTTTSTPSLSKLI